MKLKFAILGWREPLFSMMLYLLCSDGYSRVGRYTDGRRFWNNIEIQVSLKSSLNYPRQKSCTALPCKNAWLNLAHITQWIGILCILIWNRSTYWCFTHRVCMEPAEVILVVDWQSLQEIPLWIQERHEQKHVYVPTVTNVKVNNLI